MLRRLFRSRWFYDARVIGAQIKSPVQLAVGTIRALGLPDEGLALAGNLLDKMGQEPFRPPSVKGWDGGRAWINSSTMLARYNFLADLVAAGRALDRRPDAQKLRQTYLPEALQGKPSRWDEAALLELPVFDKGLAHQESAGGAVDYLCDLLLGRSLPAAKRARLVELVGQGRFDPRARETRLRLLRAILLVTSTPEHQLG